MKAPSAACASADGAFVVTKDKKNPGPRADRGSKAGCRPGQPAQGTIFRMGFEACARPSDWRRTRRRAQASRGSSAERHGDPEAGDGDCPSPDRSAGREGREAFGREQ